MKRAKLSQDSRITDIYQNPIGHDVIDKILLQMGKSKRWVTNALVGNIKLKTLAKMAQGLLGQGFADTFLNLLNIEDHDVASALSRQRAPVRPAWWKEALVYQIYPRSFKDSNGDGIGDLNGILEKLDYLADLGVDVIWLSPIYDSPNDDNGYDIRDYRRIMAEFGTMADFERLLDGVHSRGMKLIMDLVINHTSDEHAWFQESLQNPDSPYRDYYFWRSSAPDPSQPPNNWTSFFSGSAWKYYPERDAWALHLFSQKQMDLNWENDLLRADLYAMIKWWLNKGIDGFRLDVINYISKQPGLPNGNEAIGKMMGYYGIEHYFYGPRLHEFLREMRRETFDHYDVFTVGETPGIGMEMGRLLTAENRRELDMIFSFDHLENPGKVRFDDYRYDLRYLGDYYRDWMQNYGNDCWMAVFLENHDNPRMISKVNPDPQFREVIGKLLAMLQLTLKGTPFLFQGQELGMVNADFGAIEQMRDVESINLYHELLPRVGADAAFQKVLCGSRDHARTPMQWDCAAAHGGFTAGEPWISLNPDDRHHNVAAELKDPCSILNFYSTLIRLRKADPAALIYGDFKAVSKAGANVFAYYRLSDNGSCYLIELNMTAASQKAFRKPSGCTLVLSNYAGPDAAGTDAGAGACMGACMNAGGAAEATPADTAILPKALRPYEANLYRVAHARA